MFPKAPEGPKSLQLVRMQNEIDWVHEIKTGCVFKGQLKYCKKVLTFIMYSDEHDVLLLLLSLDTLVLKVLEGEGSLASSHNDLVDDLLVFLVEFSDS